jgi:hypothetical protein
MSDDANTNDDTAAANHSVLADPFTVALALCQAAERAKTIGPALKKLRRLGRDILAAERKLAVVTAQAEQKQAALAERQAALDEREAAIARREDAFAGSLAEARDELAEHHQRLVETERQLVYRIMSCAGITGEWNERMQPLPTWEQLRRMVADLPEDLPAATEVIRQENAREDWTGHVFVPGSTLTRSINKAANERI